MLQFLRRDQRRLRLPRVTEVSQPCDLPMAIFSYLLQQEFAPIFQIKQPLFWKKRQICASLPSTGQPFYEPLRGDHHAHAPGRVQGFGRVVEKNAGSQVGYFGSFLWFFESPKTAILPCGGLGVLQGPSSVEHFRSLSREKDPLFFHRSSNFFSKLSQKISRNRQLF